MLFRSCVPYRSVLLARESISHEEFTAVIRHDYTLHCSTIHPWLYVSPLNTPVPRIQLYYHSYVCSQCSTKNLHDSCSSALCPETLASAPDAQALGIPRPPNHCALNPHVCPWNRRALPLAGHMAATRHHVRFTWFLDAPCPIIL